MRKILHSGFQNLQFFHDYFCLFTFFSESCKLTLCKGGIKSEDTGKFFRLKKIFQKSLLKYYILTPPIAEILCVKNARAIVVCGFLMK